MTKLSWWESAADAPVELPGPFLLILTKEAVDHWVPRVKVLECANWGEVKQLGAEVYSEVLGLAGYGDYDELVAHFKIQGVAPNLSPSPVVEAEHVLQALDDLPEDGDPFSAYKDPGACADGDWPPSIYYLVAESVPSELLDIFGERWFTTFNGVYAILDSTKRDDIFNALTADGFVLNEDSRIGDLMPEY